MDLQDFLIKKFENWQPFSPSMVTRTKFDVTLTWNQMEQPFGFLSDHMLYRVERKEKIPPWVIVYSGGKTTKIIDNLAPSQPHKFRLQVILKPTSVSRLAEKALQHYGTEENIREHFNDDSIDVCDKSDNYGKDAKEIKIGIVEDDLESHDVTPVNNKNTDVDNQINEKHAKISSTQSSPSKPWLESQWSEEVWTATDTEGPSVICFCMAVRYGYLKQIQQMLEARPELICIINSINGFTPLITAIRKGDLATIRLLIAAGADVNQKSTAGQSPLHLAIYLGRLVVAELLIEKGADVTATDLNGLRIEHCSVDSGLLSAVKFIFDRGGDLTVRDNNGWTPLFRAILQGASFDMIEDLVSRGSDVTAMDHAGLTIPNAARLLTDKRRYPRDSVIRLVDPSYPHEQAVIHFTKLTKKISSVQTIYK